MFKKKQQKEVKEINAGSMADIAFLLLIFFLVTTTINAEKGLRVKLPPFSKEPPIAWNERNVLSIKINKLNQILVEGEQVQVSELRSLTKEFLLNPHQKPNYPLSPKKAIVSVQNDRETSYNTYIRAYNEIKGAYNELWDEKSNDLFNVDFETLDNSQKKKIQKEIPLVISEAEPFSI